MKDDEPRTKAERPHPTPREEGGGPDEVWPFSGGPDLLGWVAEGIAFGHPKSQTPGEEMRR